MEDGRRQQGSMKRKIEEVSEEEEMVIIEPSQLEEEVEQQRASWTNRIKVVHREAKVMMLKMKSIGLIREQEEQKS